MSEDFKRWMEYPRFKEWIEHFRDRTTSTDYGNAMAVLFESTGLTPDEFLNLNPVEAREKAWLVVFTLADSLDRSRALLVRAASKSFYNKMNKCESFIWDSRKHMIP